MDSHTGAPDARRDRRALLIFIALTVCFSAVTVIPIARSGSLGVWGGMAVTMFMWAPGVAGVLASVIGFRSLRPLGLVGGTSLPPWALVCLLVPVAYTVIIYPTLAAMGVVTLGRANVSVGFVTYGVFLSLRSALGEELGWRGFASPVIGRVLGFWPGQMALGVIWFLYHLPVLLLTDYGKSPHLVMGNVLFLVSVMGLSGFLGWARHESDSVWPSALFHASHNLFFLHLFDPMGIQSAPATWLVGEQGVMLALTMVGLGLYAHRAQGRRFA